jgi:hypothetical protein
MVFFSLCAASANALTMISCGASEGHAYVVEGGFVPSGKGGWIIDGISGGKFEAVKEGKEYDIRYYDATQRAYSARHDDGATVIALKDEPAALVILIVYPDLGAGSTTEVFQFRPLDKEVVWMQMKVGPVNKTAVFHAPCD